MGRMTLAANNGDTMYFMGLPNLLKLPIPVLVEKKDALLRAWKIESSERKTKWIRRELYKVDLVLSTRMENKIIDAGIEEALKMKYKDELVSC